MPKRRYIFDDIDLRCAKWMFSFILAMNPTSREPNFEAWANEIRLMRERDGRTPKQIADVFAWANKHSFWRVNILSPQKLRLQFDRLTTEMRNPVKPGSARGEMLKDAVTLTYEKMVRKYGTV